MGERKIPTWENIAKNQWQVKDFDSKLVQIAKAILAQPARHMEYIENNGLNAHPLARRLEEDLDTIKQKRGLPPSDFHEDTFLHTTYKVAASTLERALQVIGETMDDPDEVLGLMKIFKKEQSKHGKLSRQYQSEAPELDARSPAQSAYETGCLVLKRLSILGRHGMDGEVFKNDRRPVDQKYKHQAEKDKDLVETFRLVHDRVMEYAWEMAKNDVDFEKLAAETWTTALKLHQYLTKKEEMFLQKQTVLFDVETANQYIAQRIMLEHYFPILSGMKIEGDEIIFYEDVASFREHKGTPIKIGKTVEATVEINGDKYTVHVATEDRPALQRMIKTTPHEELDYVAINYKKTNTGDFLADVIIGGKHEIVKISKDYAPEEPEEDRGIPIDIL